MDTIVKGKTITPAVRAAASRNGKLGGRPLGSITETRMGIIEARKWLVEQVIANIQPLFQVLLKKSLEGDMVAFKELMDRSFGKAVQGLEVSGKDGNPIVFMPLELIQKHALIQEEQAVQTVEATIIPNNGSTKP